MADEAPRPFAPGEFITNADGSWSNEQTTTVGAGEDPGLMGGQATVIPTLWKQGDQTIHATEDQARDLAKSSGLAFPTFASDDHAEAFSQMREMHWQNIEPGSAAHLAIPPLYSSSTMRPGGAAYGQGLEPPVMDEMSAARQAGHGWNAIDQYINERRQASALGGYSSDEVNQYLGYKDSSLRLAAIGQEANLNAYGSDEAGTASPVDKLANASGNLFKFTGIGKPLMQDGPVPPELRSEYAQGLMNGEFPDAGAFAKSYTGSIFNAAGSDGIHPLAQQATQELADKLPGTQDLIDWSLALGGPDSTLTREAMMQHWVSTGEGPKGAYQRAQTDNDFRLDLTTPKPDTPPTVQAKVQAHFGEPTVDEQLVNTWGDAMLPAASKVLSAIQSLNTTNPAELTNLGLPSTEVIKAGGAAFAKGMQGVYDQLIANGLVRPDETGNLAINTLNNVNKALAIPLALIAGAGEAAGDMFEKYGEQIGQPLLGRTLKEMVVNWGGQLGSPLGLGVHEMDAIGRAKIDSTVRLVMDTMADSSGVGHIRSAPLGREIGDVMPPTSGAFTRFHDSLPADTVLPFRDAGVRVHDDVRQFQGNVAADRTGHATLEAAWAKQHPDWYAADGKEMTDAVEQRGVDGTPLPPKIAAIWDHPEFRGYRQAVFKDWSENEINLAGREGREPADRALSPYDDNWIPRQLYDRDASAEGPEVPQWIEDAEPAPFGPRSNPFRKRSGPALRTEGRQFYVREYENGTREVADNSLSKDKMQFGTQGRFRGKNFTARDATTKEIVEATSEKRPHVLEREKLPPVEEGRTRLFKAERVEDDAPHEGWVRQLTSAEQDAREGIGGARTGKIHYMDVDPKEKFSTPRPLYPDPETGKLVSDPSFPRRYNLDEKLFPNAPEGAVTSPEVIAGREPKEVPYSETPRPVPAYRLDPFKNFRDSWLATRTKSYVVQFLAKSMDELESMGMFKPADEKLANWQNEKPPTFASHGKTQAGAPIDLPLGLNGWVPKDLKAEFDRYVGPVRSQNPSVMAWDAANRFLIRSLFLSPLPHEFNVLAHYVVGRGITGAIRSDRAIRFTGQAAHQVFTNGKLYQDAQRAGGGLLFGRTVGQDIAKAHLQQMEEAILRGPGQKVWNIAAKTAGYGSGYRLVKSLYRASQKNLWFTNDTLMLGRILELQHTRGINTVEAIRAAEREIASYDVPTKFLRSKILADALSENKVVAFGRYDMNRVNIWQHMVTDLVGNTGEKFGTWSDLKVRAHALDQAGMAAALILFGAPMADALFQKIAGNPLAHLMKPGPLFLMDMARRLHDGDFLHALPFHPNAIINALDNVAHDKNLFGKPHGNGFTWKTRAKAAGYEAAALVNPVNKAVGVATGATTPQDAIASLLFAARLPKPAKSGPTAKTEGPSANTSTISVKP